MNTMIRRTLDGMLVGTLVLGLAACGGSEKRKAEYMERGKKELESANLDKARVDFSNVLQIDPKDVEARYELAQTFERLQDYRTAASHYLRIIEDHPEHLQARLHMGQIYALAGDPENALKQAEAILAKEPDNADAHVLRGGVQFRKGDIDAARKDAEAVLARDAGHVNGSILMATIALQTHDTDRAVTLLKSAADRNPQNVVVRSVLAKLYYDSGRKDEAASTLRDVVKQQPKVLGTRMQLTGYLIDVGKKEEAEALLRDGVAAAPEDDNAKLALAEFLARYQARDKAAAQLADWVKAKPDDYTLRFAQAALEEAGEDKARPKALYEQIIKDDAEGPNGLRARDRLAAVYLREQKLDDAKRLIAEVLKANAQDVTALTLRGQMALVTKDYEGAINDFRAVLKNDSNNIMVIRMQARAHQLNKQPDLAKDTLRGAITAHPQDLDLRSDYIQLLAQGNDRDAVIAALNDVLKVSPQNFGALETLFKVHAQAHDWASAQAIADRLKSTYPDKPHGAYFAGLLAQAQGKLEDSITEFDDALQKAPKAVEPLSQLVKSYLALKQPDKARERLNRILADQPQHFVAMNLLGELALVDHRFDEAIDDFRKAQAMNSKWALPYQNIALADVTQGKYDEAIKSYKDGIATAEGGAALRGGLASTYEMAKRFDDAIALYEQMLQEQPDSAAIQNNLAMLLIDQKKDPVSIERAKTLTAGFKDVDNPAFKDSYGWVQVAAGNIDAALPALQAAAKAAPNAGVMHYHLGMAQLKKGDKVAAREQLQKAVEAPENFYGKDAAAEALKTL